jgi:hypothetical protein
VTRLFRVAPERVHKSHFRSLCNVILQLLIVASQQALNAKGTCAFKAPALHVDPIDDWFVRFTAPLNERLTNDPILAAALQAVCSFVMDVSMVTLLFVGCVRRSSVGSG